MSGLQAKGKMSLEFNAGQQQENVGGAKAMLIR